MVPIEENKIEKSIPILEKPKVALFIVSYDAENHIAGVLNRIPEALQSTFREVFIYFKSAPSSLSAFEKRELDTDITLCNWEKIEDSTF